jgi:peptidoglycan hydrolase-like protein with peptidoglycan-binding domain
MRRRLRTFAAHVNAPATGARKPRAPLRTSVPATRAVAGNLQTQRALRAPEGEALRLGAGRAMPASQRRAFEHFFAADLSRVRVHDDPHAARTAQSLHARAFARGTDIAFADNAYRPGTRDGDRLLAHEVAHVVQHDASGDASIVHRAIDPETVCAAFESDQPTIRTGSTGPAVSEAQCKLNQVSEHLVAAGEEPLPDAPLAVDTIFGPRTRAAVVAFQQRVFPVTPGEWDGVVGPKTWAALDEAVADPGTPSFCPVRPNVETATGGEGASTFAGGVPGFIPCQIKPVKVAVPPKLKEMSVTVPGPVTAEATLAITPHVHLGVKFGTSGVNFAAKAIGGPGAGGEIFYSQVIRKSDRTFRAGKGSETESFTDRLDGGAQYKTTALAVARGDNDIAETDTPGMSDTRGKQVQDSRVSFHIHDEFDMFLMWRPDASAPTSQWLSYASVNWSWDARATGVTNETQLPWVGPNEAFHVCGSTTSESSSTFVKPIAPSPASHLSLPVNQPGRVAVKPLPSNLPDAKAKDSNIEKGC